jgi:hypothetical protein
MFDSHVTDSVDFFIFMSAKNIAMAVQEQPEVSDLQSLQAHRAQERAWLD